jgi:hypothetical protein
MIFAPLATALLASNYVHSQSLTERATSTVCSEIAGVLSSASAVFYPGSTQFVADMAHYSATNTQQAECSVEPATAADVGEILKIMKKSKTLFAIKSGGHSTNFGFSSTTGVHIAMRRFSEVNYDAKTNTVAIGAGMIWDDVYAALEPFAVNVIGGRVPGIGVAGFILGGGYGWKSNQYGLAVDNVKAFELVLPDGCVEEVTELSNPDLFFGLKGGFNNFGVVTKFTVGAFPQTSVWGGAITFNATKDAIDAFTAATAKFATLTDPRAVIISSYVFTEGMLLPSLLVFYDGPNPSDAFNDLLAIPALIKNVSTRSFPSLIASMDNPFPPGFRAASSTVSVQDFSLTFLSAVVNQTAFWGAALAAKVSLVTFSAEPFLQNLFQHSSLASAYPPDRARTLFPLGVLWGWFDPTADVEIQAAVAESTAALRAVALAEHQNVAGAAVYPNYAPGDTPLGDMYGGNVERLRKLRAKVDPEGVMELAGGFKF